MAEHGKGKKLGIRVTVEFGKAKKSKSNPNGGSARYVYMLKSTAEALGLKIVPSAGVKTKKGNTVAVRGAKGSGSIKVAVGGESKDGKQKYKSVPVPAGATIADIRKFLSGASKKPQSFVSVNGRSYPVVTSSK
ncbi:hypothetical protein [Fortiea contorta]|uniref:hypothetical protein n=1 Tax=Fortiea contorta TaxID=1892405 RepID=UPI000369C716|nr:hypothetical protein [Fortiea contorta]